MKHFNHARNKEIIDSLLAKIEELEEKLFTQSQESKDAVKRAIEIILEKDERIAELEEDLESAKFFQVDVVRCLSKIAWEHNHNEIPAYMELSKKCIKTIEEKTKVSDWISVEDGLPSFGVDVLVHPIKMHLGDEPVYTGHRVKGDNFEYIWAGSIYTIRNVTDWMPLPEPPKKGGAE